jgi:hypothetical protein
MNVPVVRLIDIGHGDGFSKSMTFAQSLLASLNVGKVHADVEYLRVTNLNLAARAMTQPARLVHLMAHGVKDLEGQPGFESDDARLFFGLGDVAAYLHSEGQGIEADGIFADACDSGQRRFARSLQDCLESECTYIGATREVDWREATTFASILYGALLSGTGWGESGPSWVKECADRSILAYRDTVNGRCPFEAKVLGPSRSALAAFASGKRGRGLD